MDAALTPTGPSASAWLADVAAVLAQRPAQALFARLDRGATVALVNRAKALFRTAFEPLRPGASLDLTSTATMLYYRVLQDVVVQPWRRGKEDQCDLAINSRLASALLLAVAEVVSFAWSGVADFPALTVRLGKLCSSFSVWEAIAYVYVSCQEIEDILVAPSVADYMLFMRTRILEELGWLNRSSMYQAIVNSHAGLLEASDQAGPLTDFLQAAFELLAERMADAAERLQECIADLRDVPLQQQCSLALGNLQKTSGGTLRAPEYLFANHLDLLFGQHLSNLAACCIYGVARKLNVVVSFKRIAETLCALCPRHHAATVFQHAEVAPAWNDRQSEQLGDTRMLYNTVFLPRMQDFLLPEELPPAERGAGTQQQKKGLARLPLQALSAQDAGMRMVSKRGRPNRNMH